MSPQNDVKALQRNLKRIGVVAAIVAALVLSIGVYVRLSEASDLKTWTRSTEIPTVALVTPVASGKGQALVLPGTLQAYYDAKLYARVPGYVRAWYKDIGAQVKAGELLAVIDTPELDQQISQARADLGNAMAAQKLSSSTAQRWESLLPLDAVSKQDVEDKDEDLASKVGAVKAAQANLDRLQALKGFSRIVAPFAGVVTRRTTDIGALVNAGTGTGDEPLFAVADTHALRLYVNVPQSYSAQIVPGMTVSLMVPEYPGRTFPAKLVSTSGAISAQSSSLLVEFSADNSAGLLKPGSFARVSMGLPPGTTQLQLPASALLYRSEGLRIAMLGPDGRIVLKPITIGTDMGTQVVIASGLSPRDKVVNNPPDSLAAGDVVRVGTGTDAN